MPESKRTNSYIVAGRKRKRGGIVRTYYVASETFDSKKFNSKIGTREKDDELQFFLLKGGI